MRAPRDVRIDKRVAATVATGVVVSLTALTAGITPAYAEPGGGGGGGGSGPVTTVAPEPEQPKAEEPKAQEIGRAHV